MNKQKKNGGNKYAIIIGVMIFLVIPLMLSIIVYDVISMIFPSLIFRASDLLKLYGLSVILTIGTGMVIIIKKQ